MFVQIITGQVSDAQGLKDQMDRWAAELAPGATGWLGSTAGVTADGRFVALARFESEEDAQRNSQRSEQDAWWAETSKLFTGDVRFDDSSDVVLDIIGDPDSAGFVQVMRGRGNDPDRARELMGSHPEEWRRFRPDIVGSVGVQYGDGEYTMALYFTSEAEAREGERKEPPPELKAEMDELNALGDGPPEFYDITDPWTLSPR
ncbi:MAG: hypothetical protein ACRDP9_04700 [Kribbellaceae bacterium]